MSTKDIRPTDTYTVCDVCGRTLLRGERSEVFINGGTRRSVCELCKTRALHEGWVREGAIPDYDPSQSGVDRRRPLLGRLRRRERDAGGGTPTLDDALSGGWPDGAAAPPAEDPLDELLGEPAPARARGRRQGGLSGRGERSGRSRRAPAAPAREPLPAADQGPREPRHVRAVPTSEDHKFASAIEMFNRSEHPRTIAGVAKSLGAPAVALLPDAEHPSLVRIVVSWELCWYRYEVDLSGDEVSVRRDGQGYELDELDERERVAAAGADENGRIAVV